MKGARRAGQIKGTRHRWRPGLALSPAAPVGSSRPDLCPRGFETRGPLFQAAWNTKDRMETEPRSMASVMKVSSSRVSDAPAMVRAGR